MKLNSKLTSLLTALGLVAFVAIPNAANASGSVHVDVPGLSIGIHDEGKRYRKKYRRSHHNYSNRNRYRSHHGYKHKRYHNYHNNYKSRNYRYNRNYNNRYDNYYYNDNYYYGGNRNRYRQRRVEVCPIDGYSPYYNDNLNCYRHKDHFHCS